VRAILTAIFTLLFSSGANASSQLSEQEIDAFFQLVATGGYEQVEAALSKEPALATAKDKYKFQPIHVLDYTDFDKILTLLIKNGADINAQNDKGIALLHILIDPEFIEPVLRAGADLELQDNLGRTPIMIHLTEPGGIDLAKPLLEAGANPKAQDKKGKTVLDYAQAHGDAEFIALVRKLME